MLALDSNPTTQELLVRYYNLYIGNDYALEQAGAPSAKLAKQHSEQHSRRRELLAVEQQVNKAKIVENHGKEHFRQQIENKFNAIVEKQIHNEFSNTEHIYRKIFKIDDGVPGILDIIGLKSASVSRIKLMVQSMFWLCEDLVNLVNKPQYRKNAEVKVTDPILALNYIGLENLQTVLPTFMLRHWLPEATHPFKMMKRKLWNESLSTGLAARVLAKEQGMDEFSAFCAGLFINIGDIAVVRSYLPFFEKLQQQELQKAFQRKDKKLHDVLFMLSPSPTFLHQNWREHSRNISANIIEQMGLKRLWITETFADIAKKSDIEAMTPLAKLVIQSKAFVMFKALNKHELITPEQTKALLEQVQLSAAQFALLQKSDITHLNLNIAKE